MNELQVLFTTVLNMSITASFVATGVIVARLMLKKMPRIFSYALWSAVLIRLVFPVSFTSTYSILTVIKPGTQQTTGALEYVPYNMGLMQTPGVDLGVDSLNKAVNSSLPQAVQTGSVNPMQIVMAILSVVWVVGVAVLIIYSVISYLKVINKVKTSTLVRDEIFETDRISTPFVCGFIKPKIYIPTDISQSELPYILAHERVHIKRLDYLIKPFAFLVQSVHWFNPIMWLSFFLMSKDLEMSCDESVLKIFGDETRTNYSHSLLALATGKRQLLSGSPLAFGESNVKARIKNVLNYKKPAFGVVVAALITTVALVVLLTANPKNDPISETVFTGDKVGEVAGKEIINAQDVLKTFEIEGITFKPEASLSSIEYKVGDTEPTIYKNSEGNVLFIYTFASFVERQRNFLEFEQRDLFSYTFDEKPYVSMPYNVKNLHLIYATAYPSQENTQAVSDNLRKVSEVIFSELNAGKEIIYTGESPSWDAQVSLKYYEHWWTDSDNKAQYESYHNEVPTINYKGQIPKQSVQLEYSFITRGGKMSGTLEITPQELARVINLGSGGSNGAMPNDTYEVKITVDGTTEEFELKAK